MSLVSGKRKLTPEGERARDDLAEVRRCLVSAAKHTDDLIEALFSGSDLKMQHCAQKFAQAIFGDLAQAANKVSEKYLDVKASPLAAAADQPAKEEAK